MISSFYNFLPVETVSSRMQTDVRLKLKEIEQAICG